jgi:hypothetical protein
LSIVLEMIAVDRPDNVRLTLLCNAISLPLRLVAPTGFSILCRFTSTSEPQSV